MRTFPPRQAVRMAPGAKAMLVTGSPCAATPPTGFTTGVADMGTAGRTRPPLDCRRSPAPPEEFCLPTSPRPTSPGCAGVVPVVACTENLLSPTAMPLGEGADGSRGIRDVAAASVDWRGVPFVGVPRSPAFPLRMWDTFTCVPAEPAEGDTAGARVDSGTSTSHMRSLVSAPTDPKRKVTAACASPPLNMPVLPSPAPLSRSSSLGVGDSSGPKATPVTHELWPWQRTRSLRWWNDQTDTRSSSPPVSK
mmetsp:Transcript_4550/g.13328  ORF Transcript_4550/g.13328 Transcript_4550/m.13328 type:complete len:250 (+) Transcript_4550:524-1273(+)